jgi:hypothetical protein
MTQFTYEKGNNNAELTEGDYIVMIKNADPKQINGEQKLVVDFILENGEKRTEFVKTEAWVTLFSDLLTASGLGIKDEGGEFDSDNLIGLEGTLTIKKTEGKGKHEGKTFYNAARFLLKKA